MKLQFGDLVTFTHEYRRYIGLQYQRWPAGDRSRYLQAAGWSTASEPHPESTLDLEPVSGSEPVTWRRVPVASGHLSGVFGGLCSKQEGRIGAWGTAHEDGHTFRRLGTVHLAEVMVQGAGRPLLVVVHPDDLTLAVAS